jgi:hypothetical protein
MRTGGLIGLLACLVASPVLGHGVHVTRGELTVTRDRIVASAWSVGDHDDGGARWLLDALAVHDHRGARLPARLVETGMTGNGSRTTFELRPMAPPRHLTLRLTPLSAVTGAGRARKLDLEVVSDGLDAAERVHLTSGGNAETLSFEWEPGRRTPKSHDPCSLDGTARGLKRVQGLLTIGDQDVRLSVSIPLPMLETWLPVPRMHRDVLAADEQAAVRGAVLDLVRERASLSIDGRAVGATSDDVVFLGLDDSAAASPPIGPLSAWTARARVSLVFDATRPDRADVDWRLFNAAILTGRLVVQDGSGCTLHRVSTYEPVVSWRR